MIALHRDTITRKEMDALLSNIIDGSISPGELGGMAIQELGKSLSWKQSYGVALRSCEQAYEIALGALNLPKGSLVGVSPLASSFLVEQISLLELTPYTVHVDERTLLPSSQAIQEGVQAGISALLLSSPAGNIPKPEDYEGVGIPVIEDITLTIGSTCNDVPVGSVGSAVILSGDQPGVVAMGGGALLATDSLGLWRNIRKVPNFSRPSYQLPDLNVSLVISQLKYLGKNREKRAGILKLYQDSLRKSGRNKSLLHSPEGVSLVPAFFPLLLDGSVQDARAYAKKKGITIGALVDSSVALDELPSALKQIALRGVVFPLYPLLSREEIDTIARVLTTLP